MQKSAQLSLDIKEIEKNTVEQNLLVGTIQQTLKKTAEDAANAKKINLQIPELEQAIATVENERDGFQKQIESFQNTLQEHQEKIQAQKQLAREHVATITQLQNDHGKQQQVLDAAKDKNNKVLHQLTLTQEQLSRRNEQLQAASQTLDEKNQVIASYTEQIEITEEKINHSKTVQSINSMNLTLVLDELAIQSQMVNRLQDELEKISGQEIPTDLRRNNITAISEIQSLMEQMGQRKASLNNQVSANSMAQINELEITIATLQSNGEDQNMYIKGLLDKLQEQDESFVLLQEALQQQELNNKNLHSELEDTIQQSNDANLSLADQISLLENKLTEALNAKALFDKEKTETDSLLSEMRKTNTTLNSKLSDLKTELGESSAKITQIDNDIEVANTSLQQKEDARVLLNTELEDAKLSLAQSNEKLQKLTTEHSALKTQLNTQDNQQKTKISSMQQIIDNQNSNSQKISTEFDTKLESATAAIQSSQKETETLKNELQQATETALKHKKTISTLTEELSTGTEKIKTLRENLGQEKQQTLDKTNANVELKKQISKLTEELANTQNSITVANEKQTTSNTEKDTQIQNLMAKLAENKTHLAASVANLEQISSQQADTTANSTAKQEEISKLTEAVSIAKAVAEEQVAKLKSADEQISEYEKQQQDFETNLADKQKQLNTNQEELSELKSTLTAITTERDQLLLRTTDSDKDGVSDADDSCPKTIEGAKVNAEGCEEDNDNDGLVNRLDLCPDTASGSTIDNAGCSAEQNIIVLEGITFQFGTAELTDDAKYVLANTSLILQANPEIYMEIAGHTDSIGDEQSNIQLSTLRAQAVLAYLIEEDVLENRLQAKGYGANEPIADNTTKVGRAKNRRVELRRVEGVE